MKYTLMLLTIGIILVIIPFNNSEPGFNGPTPGCDGSGCHSFEDGIVSASLSDLDVSVTVSGTSSSVAGELVDENGTVVSVNNSTSNNPFTLTAPGPGTYTVNAGFKNPNRRWDSTTVTINVTGVSDNSTSPSTFKLFDNYPNPFNPSTVIKYSVAKNSFTTLNVYNSVGKLVTTLVNETKTSGTYEVEFNAEGLSSGIYYYKLTAGSFSETKKMILLK